MNLVTTDSLQIKTNQAMGKIPLNLNLLIVQVSCTISSLKFTTSHTKLSYKSIGLDVHV